MDNYSSITVTSVIGILALGSQLKVTSRLISTGSGYFLGVGALCMIIPETITDIVGIIMVIIAITVNIITAKRKANPSLSS